MKTFLTIFCCFAFFTPALAGEVWVQTIVAPAPGAAIPVDLGQTMQSLESIEVWLSGHDQVGGYSCDGPDGSYMIPELHWVTGTFGQGLTDGVDSFALNSYQMRDDEYDTELDHVHVFDTGDQAAWEFLNAGPVDFVIDYYTAEVSPSGFCTHYLGEFSLDEVVLVIHYNGIVATDDSTWDRVKALYR